MQTRSRAACCLVHGLPGSTTIRCQGRAHSTTSLRQGPQYRSASFQATKKVLVPLGNGTEEMEAVTIIDVMRRAGATVTVASVESDLTVKCSRDVKIVADELISHAAERQFDLIVLPGGAPGSEALKQSNDLRDLLKQQQSNDKPYAAMCAAPAVVLEAHGLLKGKKATAHPAFVSKLTDSSAAEQRVVVDGNLVTSRGPGTALEFALALVEQLYEVKKPKKLLCPWW
ncbi:hypothetical protein WJX79_002168 [Trebouxia sp. C0005]